MNPEIELKRKMKEARLKIRDVALFTGRPYATIANAINGYAQMSDELRNVIHGMIAAKQGICPPIGMGRPINTDARMRTF